MSGIDRGRGTGEEKGVDGDAGKMVYSLEKGMCNYLLTSSRRNPYLADIDKQAQERFERLIESMKQIQDKRKHLKAENALEWIGRMNNIRACVRAIVEKEIVYA